MYLSKAHTFKDDQKRLGRLGTHQIRNKAGTYIIFSAIVMKRNAGAFLFMTPSATRPSKL